MHRVVSCTRVTTALDRIRQKVWLRRSGAVPTGKLLRRLRQGAPLQFTTFYTKDTDHLLASLCEKYGSDKGAIGTEGHPYPWEPHTYVDFYSRTFGHCRSKVTTVFECGLGTDDPDVPSSMQDKGKPGASLRAWRDYFPNARVYGADIDRSTLFTEDRIQTFYVDQTSPDDIAALWDQVPEESFDLIIDDGWHVFDAGRCFFEHSIQMLGPEGIYVIEDVTSGDLLKYQEYFAGTSYRVDLITLFRPGLELFDNSLVVVRNT